MVEVEPRCVIPEPKCQRGASTEKQVRAHGGANAFPLFLNSFIFTIEIPRDIDSVPAPGGGGKLGWGRAVQKAPAKRKTPRREDWQESGVAGGWLCCQRP